MTAVMLDIISMIVEQFNNTHGLFVCCREGYG